MKGKSEGSRQVGMAREEGFEPPVAGPEPAALPLGYSRIAK